MSTNSETIDFEEIQERIISKAVSDEAYKQRLLSDAKSVVEEEIGEPLPSEMTIQVLQQSPNHLYFLLPMIVEDDLLTEAELLQTQGGSTSIKYKLQSIINPPRKESADGGRNNYGYGRRYFC